MPLYHFNLTDHIREPDETGTELPDDEKARVEAVIFAGAYLKDNPDLLRDDHEFRVEVTDDDGNNVFAVVMRAIRPSR